MVPEYRAVSSLGSGTPRRNISAAICVRVMGRFSSLINALHDVGYTRRTTTQLAFFGPRGIKQVYNSRRAGVPCAKGDSDWAPLPRVTDPYTICNPDDPEAPQIQANKSKQLKRRFDADVMTMLALQTRSARWQRGACIRVWCVAGRKGGEE